jgi:putative redox protein
MVEVNVVYEGQLHCAAMHDPSGSIITTDAPRDNMGKGESFSPTDLVATGLATCIVTTMGIMAQRHGLDISGTKVRVEKHMSASGLRRIARLPVEVRVPRTFGDEDRQRLENAARTCPVHKSLHPEIDSPITISWGQ